MKIFLGIIVRRHHRSETNGIAERAVRRVKEGTSAVLLQSGLDENWWADSMECYAYLQNIQNLLFDGKTPYERRSGESFKGPIIPFGSLVEYYPTSAKDQSRIHQFGKKVLPGLFLGYALYAGRIWKGDVLIADLEELETMDASEIYSERLNAMDVIFPKKWKNRFSSRRWTNQTFWERSGTENTHFDTGTPNSRRRSKIFSWRIRIVSTFTTSRLTSGCRWSDKWFLVHVRKLERPPSRWTESQTLLAERRIIPYSTEIHWRLQNNTYKLGCHARTRHRRLLEHRWVKRFVWFLDRFHSVYSIRRETSRRIYFVLEATDKTAGNFISLTMRTRQLKKPLRMQEENWKHQRLPLCFARQARRVSMERPVARLTISNQSLRVSWKLVNPQDCVWTNLYRIITRITLQERGHITTTLQFSTQIYSYASSHEDTRCKSNSG